MITGIGCFADVRLDPDSYSALLIGLSVDNLYTNVEFNGGSSTYFETAVASRATLIGRGWTIIDGGIAPPPVITSPTAVNALVNSAFTYVIIATNGPTAYNATGLPTGLTRTGNTISGTTPAIAGMVVITISATSPRGTASAVLTLSVSATGAPTITSSATAAGMTGQAFTYAITASNSPTAFTCSALPSGLTFTSATGVISGTPSSVGNSVLTIGASNAQGTSAAPLTLTITAPVPGGGSQIGTSGSGGGGGGGGCGAGSSLGLLVALGMGMHGLGRRRRRGQTPV